MAHVMSTCPKVLPSFMRLDKKLRRMRVSAGRDRQWAVERESEREPSVLRGHLGLF